MWTNEHSIETAASADAIWRLWSDVPGWQQWIADIEQIEISGPFEAGSTIRMTPTGQDPVELRIAEAVAPELFVDEADLGDVVVRTLHRVEPVDARRNRVVYRMEISGPAADSVGPELGPQISGDFPETLAALVERAEADGAPPEREPRLPALARHAALAAWRRRRASAAPSHPRAVRAARLHLVAEGAGRYRHQDDLSSAAHPRAEGPARARG